eukprot:2188874-Pleurochrysis_carterae.AAC.1
MRWDVRASNRSHSFGTESAVVAGTFCVGGSSGGVSTGTPESSGGAVGGGGAGHLGAAPAGD